MSNPISIVAGITDTLNTHNAAQDLIESINNGTDTFSIIDQTGQLIASITTAIPALRPIAIQANAFAGTTSFAKIGANLAGGRTELPINEILSVVGNVAGIVATIAIFAAVSGPVATWAGAIGLSVGLMQLSNTLYNSPTYQNMVQNIWNDVWSSAPEADVRYVYVAPDGRLVDQQTLQNEYDGRVLMINIDVYGYAEPSSIPYDDIGDYPETGSNCKTNMDDYDPERDNYYHP